MPLYDYDCPRCEHTFETLVFDDAEAVECPQCHSRDVRRRLGVPAKPLTQPAALPSACNASGPPCGPTCGRLRG